MSVRLTVCCDSSWGPERMPCRASLPTAASDVDDAVDLALVGGWSTHLVEVGGDEVETHYCPACTRLAVTEK